MISRSDLASSGINPVPAVRVVGRYRMYEQIASGGMASIHLGRLMGAVGFSRIVAIKHLHSHHIDDGDFVSMFVDEARLAARIHHPNVATTLDVVLDEGEIFLVKEYVHGETLGHLLAKARSAQLMIPPPVTAAILSGALRGLHAAHEAVDENGQPLNIIHRDVSPQNIMVGVDGIARVLDFGVAKSVGRCQSTRQGRLKGKLSYMAPEQVQPGPVDRRLDIFAAGIVFWEALTRRRLFSVDDLGAAISSIVHASIARPSAICPDLPRALDQIVMKALERNAEARFQTAREFADAVEGAIPLAPPSRVGEWVGRLCRDELSRRAGMVAKIERPTCEITPLPRTQQPPSPHRRRVLLSAVLEEDKPGEEPPTRREEAPALAMDHRKGSQILQSTLAHGRPGHVPWARRTWRALAGASALTLLVGLAGSRLSVRAAASSEPTQPQPSTVGIQKAITSPLPDEAALNAGPSQTQSDAALQTKAVRGQTKGGFARGASPVGHPRRAQSMPAKPVQVEVPSSRNDCAIPYTIDGRGIRRVKPQCR